MHTCTIVIAGELQRTERKYAAIDLRQTRITVKWKEKKEKKIESEGEEVKEKRINRKGSSKARMCAEGKEEIESNLREMQSSK